MNTKVFDVAIVGAGVAGVFAAYKIAKDHPKLKTVILDLGRPPGKRRRQLEGWFGCFPNSDGKLYQSDLDKVSAISGNKKAKSADKWFNSNCQEIIDLKVIQDKKPQVALDKKITKHNFQLQLNDYIQLIPAEIHTLSKYIANFIEEAGNTTLAFDQEDVVIDRDKKLFTISTNYGQYSCKKVIIATGRSGWRWASSLFAKFGIIDSNDISYFGIKAELPSYYMKEFNKSNCSLSRNDLEIGPFNWQGTVIPEDHVDVAISSFRSNENRWKSDKVSFNIIGKVNFEGKGVEQTDRISKLTFILSNDRVLKEKISLILNKRSKISILPEYNWLPNILLELNELIPNLISKGSFHVPTIITIPPKIKIGDNFVTEADNMYVCGEAAGIQGIHAAILSGIIAGDSVAK